MSKVKVVKDTAERYLLTYADLMNLLLILFIILFAMSQTDASKFNKLAQSLREAFGNSSSASYMTPGASGNSIIDLQGNASTIIPANLEQQQLDELQEKMKELIEKQNLQNDINLSVEERGIVISVTAKLLFKSGSAEVEQTSKPTIEEIGQLLKAIPANQIRVEGNTDTDPIISSIYPSNWELSSARATNVLRLLVDKAGIDPTHISAVGYGEFRPKVNNDTEQHKAENRRVDIVIVKSKFDKAEAGVEGKTN